MLKPEWFRRMEVGIEGRDIEFVDQINEAMLKRKMVDRVVEKAIAGNEKEWEQLTPLCEIKWQERLYVPRDKRLREDIIRAHHDSIAAGHPGRYKTQELITQNYWWPYIQSNVRKYTDGCIRCQETKIQKGKIHAPLHPNAIPNTPWEHISVDLIGPLPESSRYNTIMVIIDRFSKYIIALLTNMELSAFGAARIYRDHVWTKFGLPRKTISDRGPQFAAQFMRDLYTMTGVESNLSTAYHPQTDGQTECINQEVEQYLRISINERQTDWSDWLPSASFSYNNKTHLSTGYSPFYIKHGMHPYIGTNPRTEYTSQSAKDFIDEIKKVRQEAKSSLKQAAETMKKFYNCKKSNSCKYSIGDKVW